MKSLFKPHPILLSWLACLLPCAAARESAPSIRIARFAGDRPAAISYTFDDGLRDQYTLAVPMLNEFGFKGTFFIVPGTTAETVGEAERKMKGKRAWGSICWSELREMAAQGHEIGNHSWSHKSLPQLTPAEVVAEISKAREEIGKRLGKAPLTLAFPFNQSTPEIQRVALESHVACRLRQHGTGGASTVEALNRWADRQVLEKSWGVVMLHAIQEGFAAFSDPEVFRGHLRYVKSRKDAIWVETFATVARYEKERENAVLRVSAADSGRVEFLLAGTLDPAVYDVPLTIVIEAAGAERARAMRAGVDLPVRIRPGALEVDAAPAQEPVTVFWK